MLFSWRAQSYRDGVELSPSGWDNSSSRVPPWWLRRALGRAIGYGVLLLVLIPFYVVIALAGDFLVNHAEATGPLPWLHSAAVPAEVGLFVVMMVGVVAFVGYLFVGGAVLCRDAARRTVGGRWTTGVVRGMERQETDSDGDVSYHWLVEFTDQDSSLNTVGFVSHSFSRRRVVEGTVMQVRYRIADPRNAIAIHPGMGPRLTHWLSGMVALGLWAFFVASIPVGVLVAGLVWLVQHL